MIMMMIIIITPVQMLTQLQMLRVLRLQPLANSWGRVSAHSSRCDRGHVQTLIGYLRHLVAFTLPLELIRSTGLEPPRYFTD